MDILKEYPTKWKVVRIFENVSMEVSCKIVDSNRKKILSGYGIKEYKLFLKIAIAINAKHHRTE